MFLRKLEERKIRKSLTGNYESYMKLIAGFEKVDPLQWLAVFEGFSMGEKFFTDEFCTLEAFVSANEDRKFKFFRVLDSTEGKCYEEVSSKYFGLGIGLAQKIFLPLYVGDLDLYRRMRAEIDKLNTKHKIGKL